MGLEYPSVRTVDIDLGRIEQVREKMPIIEHRRRDLYSLMSLTNIMGMKFIFYNNKKTINKKLLVPVHDKNEETISWGQLRITTSQIFFRSTLTLALVNKKPIVPGRKFIFHNFSF